LRHARFSNKRFKQLPGFEITEIVVVFACGARLPGGTWPVATLYPSTAKWRLSSTETFFFGGLLMRHPAFPGSTTRRTSNAPFSCCLLVLCLCPIRTGWSSTTHLVEQPPVSITKVADHVVLIDFGRVAFGNIELSPPAGAKNEIEVHFGEAFAEGRVNRSPPGTVRYAAAKATLAGAQTLVVAPAADKRNTEAVSNRHPPAILTPAEWGVVLPFRWVEIEGWPGELKPEQIRRRAAFAKAWNDSDAEFHCSDELLNRIWELCRYSIKATTFAGVFVDGDRERIPYEADAYLNQLSYYTTTRDIKMPRDTFDHLMKHGTWPTEWAPHMVFMAYADWKQTGDKEWLAKRYESLKTKLLLDRVGPEGLVRSADRHVKKEDIVDWPKGERDGYVFTPLNTVVNAFYLRALALMMEMGEALGRDADVAEFSDREAKGRAAFQAKFFDQNRRLYRDGATTDHSSLHANLFPLAFGLVPPEDRRHVADWLAKRGMKCSVYAAQYLLEGLFENGQASAAIELITAQNDRSWRHMVESGATISWEAWDLKYKPNQDWNHAWGAAPANLLPYYVLGVRSLEAGWARAIVCPRPGQLTFARGKMPTPRGPILVDWKRGETFSLSLELPEGVTARVHLPAAKGSEGVFVAGKRVGATRKGDRWILAEDVADNIELEVK
jgi:alpha-L-rhamnosidase